MNYQEFIASKQLKAVNAGFDINIDELNSNMFEWQKMLVKWGLKKGKCAFFEDCGLGKTIQQLVWADETRKYSNKPSLILAPLAVAEQTKLQGEKFGVEVNICEFQADIKNTAVNITNYEKLHNFDCKSFGSVALDESSILKNSIGKVRTQLIDEFKYTPFRSCWSATPAPNDYMELGNHSEFLGIMGYFEMLATFFVHDGGDTSKWRLKGHAVEKFWDWIASWAAVVPNPNVLDFYDERYSLQTVTVKPRHFLCESYLTILRRNMDCKALNEPLPTITAHANHFAKTDVYLKEYDGDNLGHWSEIRELLNTYTDWNISANQVLIFCINGVEYFISDIGLRMLQPKELYKAQGFPDDYIIDKDCNGKEYNKTKQVARCGNAVPPPFSKALVIANCKWLCDKPCNNMKEFNAVAAG